MGTRRPPQPSDNAAIARALRSDSDLMRYSEWWVRRRIYGTEDESIKWLTEQYVKAYKDILRTLPEAYDENGRPILAQRARLLAQVEREVNALYAALGVKVPQDVENGFRQGYYGRAWLLDTVTVPEFTANKRLLLPSEQIRALLAADYVGTDQWISLNRAQLIDRVKRSLTASMISGEGMQKAARRLRNELGAAPGQKRDFKGAAWKTLLIARTEIMRASNLGALAVYEENQDILKGWEWVATRDERTCPICGGLDGKVFPFGSRQLQPPSGSHPGCRCTVMPVLIDEDIMQQVGGVRETYCEWAARTGVVDDAELCQQRGSDAHRINATSTNAPAPITDAEQAQNNASLDLARGMSPNVMLTGATKGELFDYMIDFFAFNDQAQPIFDPAAIDASLLDFKLGVFRLGRGQVQQQVINDSRLRAAGLLGADGWLARSTLNSEDRALLLLLASPDDETVLAQIDSIRDRRLRGTLAQAKNNQRTRGGYGGFVSAAGADGAQMLRDFNTW